MLRTKKNIPLTKCIFCARVMRYYERCECRECLKEGWCSECLLEHLLSHNKNIKL